jgi:hypothetical protein
MAESRNGLLGIVCATAGEYTLAMRDRDYRGGENYRFRIDVGAIPIVTAVAPLGLQRGTESRRLSAPCSGNRPWSWASFRM